MEKPDQPLKLADLRTAPQVTNDDQELLVLLEKIVAFEKKKAETKEFFEQYDELIVEALESLGLDFHFQDDSGIVYKLDRMEWKAVKMTPYQIARTRYEGEAKGSLSMTKARELGYEVEGK